MCRYIGRKDMSMRGTLLAAAAESLALPMRHAGPARASLLVAHESLRQTVPLPRDAGTEAARELVAEANGVALGIDRLDTHVNTRLPLGARHSQGTTTGL